MKKKQKGFTLVELLVVIAIIAILATVSVVGYLSFTEKAKESNDVALIKQLNTILDGEETLNGKPETMHEALLTLEDGGFNVQKITPTSSKNEFVWNQEKNEFTIIPVTDLNGNSSNPLNWLIVDSKEELISYTSKYSVYISDKYTDNSSVVVNNGFDAGNNTIISSVTYETNLNQSVIIRTNNGDLNVNAANGVVNHYGKGNKLNVINIDKNSYHEFGSYNSLEIANGHVVVEEKGSINAIIINKENEKNVSIETKNPNAIKALYASDSYKVTGSTVKASSFITTDNLQGYELVNSKEELVVAIKNNVTKVALGSDIVINQDLTKDNKYSSDFVINEKCNITINMNGHNINSIHNIAIGHNVNNEVFNISKGSLTLEGLGNIELANVGNNMGWNAASSVIVTNGNLTINGPVTLINHGGTDMSFALDHRAWGLKLVKTELTDATLISETYRTVRIFGNHVDYKHKLVITNSNIISYKNAAIWKQYENDIFALSFNSGLIESKSNNVLKGINKNNFEALSGTIIQNNKDITNTFK